MEDNNNLQARDLLPCFFSQCEARFRFLEQAHGYSYIAGLLERRGDSQVIKPYSGVNQCDADVCVTRYERGHQVIEVLYDAQRSTLEAYVYYDRVRRFDFYDVLMAAGKADDFGGGPVGEGLDKEALEDGVEYLATAVRLHTHYFTNIDDVFLKRAADIRAGRMQVAIERQYKKQMDYACAMAKRAFVQGDFLAVLSLLEPLEAHLRGDFFKVLILSRQELQH